jgi:hypothetical protein
MAMGAHRVRSIRPSHEICLSLADVQESIRGRGRGRSICRLLSARLRARLEAVDGKAEELAVTRGILARSLERCEDREEGCPVVTYLEVGDGDAGPGA